MELALPISNAPTETAIDRQQRTVGPQMLLDAISLMSQVRSTCTLPGSNLSPDSSAMNEVLASCVLVLEGSQLVGLVTLLRWRRVEEVMASSVIHASKSASVLEVAQLMRERVSCVVIAQETTEKMLLPLGTLTEGDIVQLNEFFPRWASSLAKGDIVQGIVAEFPQSERLFLEPQGILSLILPF